MTDPRIPLGQRRVLAHQLQRRRERIGLTRRDVAEHLHAGRDVVARWEQQAHVPHDDILAEWNKYINDEEIRALRFLARLHPTEIPDLSNDIATLGNLDAR